MTTVNNPNDDKPRAGGALLVVLVSVMGVGPLFPFMLSTSSALVIERFGVTPGQLGLISSVVFGSAALASQSSGWFADRFSVRQQILLNFGGAAAAFAIAAFTTNYYALLVAAAISGCSQAISNPTTNRVILEVVDSDRQTNWIGVKQSGVQVAQLFSGVIFPILAVFLGWVGAGFGGIVVALSFTVFAMRIVSRYYVGNDLRTGTSGSEQDDLLLKIGQHRIGPVPVNASGRDRRDSTATTRLILALIIFLIGFGVQAVHVFLPLYAVTQMGFSLLHGGLTITVIGIVGMFSRIWWARRVGAGARLSSLLVFVCGGAAIGVLLLLVAKGADLTVLIWIAAVVHGMTGLGGNVIINAGVIRAAPPGQIGRVSGINSMAMYSGFTLGPVAMGGLLDWTGGFESGWSAALAVFILGVGGALWLRWHQRDTQARAW